MQESRGEQTLNYQYLQPAIITSRKHKIRQESKTPSRQGRGKIRVKLKPFNSFVTRRSHLHANQFQSNQQNIHPQLAPLTFPPPTSHFPTEPTQLAPSTTPIPPLLHGQPDVFSAVEASGFISKGRSPLCPPFKYLLLFCLLSAAGICTGDPLLRDLRWKETTTSTTHRRQGPKENGQ